MTARSKSKGEDAAASLRTSFPAAKISVWILQQESYDSITAFAKQCESLPRIDIAILNIGVGNNEYTIVPSTQHESTMQVNYLSTALVALLLLPILKSKKVANSLRPPVLSIVGSDSVYLATLETDGPVLPQFERRESFDGFAWYWKSKLLLMLFIPRLAELVNPEDVLVNLTNPGLTTGTSLFGSRSAMHKFM